MVDFSDEQEERLRKAVETANAEHPREAMLGNQAVAMLNAAGWFLQPTPELRAKHGGGPEVMIDGIMHLGTIIAGIVDGDRVARAVLGAALAAPPADGGGTVH